jgi:hypothetical protein
MLYREAETVRSVYSSARRRSGLDEVDAALFALLRDARFKGQRFVDMRQLVAADTPVAAVSRLPECLDFVAACAVFAFGYGLAWQTGLIAYLVSTLSSSPN